MTLIDVRVSDVGGTSVSGATVTFAGLTATTTPAGEAIFTVAAGTYDLQVSKNGYQTYTQTGIWVPNTISQVVDVTLQTQTAPTYSNVTITITPTGSGTTTPAEGNHPSTYLVGDDLWITANQASGWQFSVMNRNGSPWTGSNPGGFLNLAATENIEVVFVQSTAPPNDGGGFDPHILIGVGAVAGVAVVIYWLLKR
jgi:hypothetical protein